ncbi:MAG: isoaspartyl peptidase/L-asparaginase [candidate division WOR-3 bacterium]|nr:isoaspartyl peptidase/L-asparaginase [candidate division WOR-3 bacterium]MCX7837558.1 isoaspartyl peptidase/L-asparaginase [candidate division WOR-3 bacterium]MDW8114053.1 isoaspartyl peptidase/L-asparaginase [candidate division WOR-3 bacterium]
MIALIVHGGAGKIEEKEEAKKGIEKALIKGYEILAKGGKAVDAVCTAVCELEDNPYFNAGTGSVLNLLFEIEMDASIMVSSGDFGACGAIKNVKNPILVARKIMEETDHLLLVGEGANIFAKAMGFPEYNPKTEKEVEKLKKLIEKGENLYFPNFKKLIEIYKNLKKEESYSTVGACALDHNGMIAVATSTGGIRGKLPGRIGDSAIIGAGTYATPLAGVSATGHGESITKNFVAKEICELVKNYDIQTAINIIMEELKKKNCFCGVIGIDVKGNVGHGYNTKDMAWGFIKDGKLVTF